MYRLSVTDSTLHMVRQWCRIFANANRFVERVKGKGETLLKGEMLLNFFVARPVGAAVHMCMCMLYCVKRVCMYLSVYIYSPIGIEKNDRGENILLLQPTHRKTTS